MNRCHVLLVTVTLIACGDDGGGGGGGDGDEVTDAEFQLACENGVALCQDDPSYGDTFGAQDCSVAAIEAAYASCDSSCRANSRPIVDCQAAATDCASFAGCVSAP